MNLQAAGCPVGRHELRDELWLALGVVKRELERLAAEEAQERAERKRRERERNA